jgi:hypothetical protein
MSAIAVPAAPSVVPVLAMAEARRLLRHPVMVGGFALWAALTTFGTLLGHPRARDVFEAVGSTQSWTPGLPAIFVAYLVATRERRSGTLDVIGSLPVRDLDRVRGLCLASLGPGLVALVLNVAAMVALDARHGFPAAVSPAHVLLPPLTVVGAVLMGVMVAVWAPFPLAPALATILMIAFHVVVETGEPGHLFAPAVFWAAWPQAGGEYWIGYLTGSPWWHLLYVAGLCGLAAAAALLRVAPRVSQVVPFGLGALVVTVTGALVQLP